jgi:hypothetical protein
MGVKLRERPGKGWYVFTDWNGQRKAKFFGKNKALAKAFADKLAAKLKWAEQSGEAVTLATPDGTIPTVEASSRSGSPSMPRPTARRPPLRGIGKWCVSTFSRHSGPAVCVM